MKENLKHNGEKKKQLTIFRHKAQKLRATYSAQYRALNHQQICGNVLF